ncbi:serine/threonine protein kinase, partial [Streptomyces anthocyanicus]
LLRKDPAERPDATEAEHLLAQAAEGRRPDAAQAYVPTTRYEGPPRAGDTAVQGMPAGGAGATPYPQAGGSGATPYPQAGGSGATPYPPTTGPTGAGPAPTGHTRGGYTQGGHTEGGYTAPGYAPAPAVGGAAPGRARRVRMRTLALVVAVAALIGAGTAVVLHQRDEGGSSAGADPTQGPTGSAAPSPSPSASATTGKGPGGSVPADWTRRDDPLGFSLYLPENWQRRDFDGDSGELRQIDYTPDGGNHVLRISVDTAPDYNDPYAHQQDLDAQLLQRLVDYRRVKLERAGYRDRDSARWEYTWTALAKDTEFPGPRRAVSQMYMSRDGVEYALNMTGPAGDWPTTQRRFKAVLQGWQEETG